MIGTRIITFKIIHKIGPQNIYVWPYVLMSLHIMYYTLNGGFTAKDASFYENKIA